MTTLVRTQSVNLSRFEDLHSLKIVGRVLQEEDSLEFAWPGTRFEGNFHGTQLTLDFDIKANLTLAKAIPFELLVDGITFKINLESKVDGFVLIEGLKLGDHHFSLTRKVEAFCGPCRFKAFHTDGYWLEAPAYQPLIQFIGDSIVSGYGIESPTPYENYKSSTQNVLKTAGFITCQKLNFDFEAICHSGKGLLSNFDGSQRETLPDIYERNQVHRQEAFDIASVEPWAIFLQIGTNDFAMTPPPSLAFEERIVSFSNSLRSAYPRTHVVWLLGPMLNNDWPMNPITGQAIPSLELCRKAFKNAFKQLQERFYLLELTGQNPSRGFGANWHPNILQHQLNAMEIQEFIENSLMTKKV